MVSTPEDRLAVILRLYETARDQQDSDMAEVTSDAQADAIENNVDTLRQDYMRAERQRLEASGPAVESAYQSARDAADDVTQAYQKGKGLADRIRAVTDAVGAVSDLMEKGSGGSTGRGPGGPGGRRNR